MIEALEIGVHCRRDGERTARRPWRLGKRCNLASFPLGLKEVECIFPVGGRMIIGGADRLDAIGFLAKIPAQDPFSPSQPLAITKMQSWIDRAPIGLAGMLELCPRCRAI
jgi:hypothetical protein